LLESDCSRSDRLLDSCQLATVSSPNNGDSASSTASKIEPVVDFCLTIDEDSLKKFIVKIDVALP
jgi:hypothetical protein